MDLNKILAELNFSELVRNETRKYWESRLEYTAFDQHDTNSDKLVVDGRKRFSNKGDQINYLVETINYLNEGIEDIHAKIRYDYIQNFEAENFSGHDYDQYYYHKSLANKKINFEAIIFYSVRALEKAGVKNLDTDAFSTNQAKELKKEIDGILAKLDHLALGQEIIYDSLDELRKDLAEMKSDFPLGRKRWYQRYAGIVAKYVGTKSADALFDLLKPDLLKILQNSGIGKLLH